MKILIDISPIIYETGVSRYTQKLIEHLLKVDKENEYLFYGGSLRRIKDLENKVKNLKGNFKTKFYRIAPTLGEFIWNRLHFIPIETLTGKVDVFHSSDWYQPLSNGFKVTTVHDLAPVFFPEFTHPKVVAAHSRRLDWVKKEVDRIIVPSESTKNDLVKLDFDKEKIRVIPEAVDSDFGATSKEKVDEIKKKYEIKGKYLLTIGVGGRRNTENLTKAFNIANLDMDLVLVGGHAGSLPKASSLVYTGHVPESDLAALYTGAECLVYPSIYEGFGLPILEAFACGTPVITSNTSSLPEIGGNAVVLVDPKDTQSIANGIKKALKDSTNLKKKGLRRLKDFSWTNTAEQTLKVYKEL